MVARSARLPPRPPRPRRRADPPAAVGAADSSSEESLSPLLRVRFLWRIIHTKSYLAEITRSSETRPPKPVSTMRGPGWTCRTEQLDVSDQRNGQSSSHRLDDVVLARRASPCLARPGD